MDLILPKICTLKVENISIRTLYFFLFQQLSELMSTNRTCPPDSPCPLCKLKMDMLEEMVESRECGFSREVLQGWLDSGSTKELRMFFTVHNITCPESRLQRNLESILFASLLNSTMAKSGTTGGLTAFMNAIGQRRPDSPLGPTPMDIDEDSISQSAIDQITGNDRRRFDPETGQTTEFTGDAEDYSFTYK